MNKYIVLIFAVFLVGGCTTAEQKEMEMLRREMAATAWRVCLDSGGVPLQSWFSSTVLGDCKYPPTVPGNP